MVSLKIHVFSEQRLGAVIVVDFANRVLFQVLDFFCWKLKLSLSNQRGTFHIEKVEFSQIVEVHVHCTSHVH